MKEIFKIESYGITPLIAAEYFAETYWDKPRKIHCIKNGMFTIVDGSANYVVEHIMINNTGYFRIVINWKTFNYRRMEKHQKYPSSISRMKIKQL